MIRSIQISNYALISDLSIDFTDGLNIITGETGAGKSIILGALNLLLGARADAKVITDTSKKSVIEAVFSLETPEEFRAFFTQNDLDFDGDTVILRRELSPMGRSRAFINDSPVNITLLRELAIRLVDIHSQHQNLLLADSAYQMHIIDRLADSDSLLAEYQTAYADYQKTLKKYASTRDAIRRGRDESDFLSYQLNELEQLNLIEGEEAELEHERDTLARMTEVKALICEASAPLSSEENTLIALDHSVDALRELADTIPEAEQLADRMDAVLNELRDIASTLENYNDSYNADPVRLEDIESRLSRIYSLETKHHVDNSQALVALRAQLKSQLDMLDNGDQLLSQLENDARTAKKKAVLIARRISENRQRQALEFAVRLRAAAEPLGMKNLRCDIAVTTGRLNASGIDEVQFLFAFNKNQPMMPVGQTASGGEISRIMLAVKAIIGRHMNLPSIIFDEIDTGVSGEVASAMGDLMTELSQHIQVITITHLPQVAAKGHSHFKVYKQDNDQATNTHIRRLTQEERVSELALMLSGSTDNPAATAAARSLLENNPTTI